MTWKTDRMASREPLKILIHEFVTGGGLAGEPLPESWAIEGAAMRRSLATDFAAAGRPTRVVVTLDPRLPRDDGPWETIALDSSERLESFARGVDLTVLIAPESSGVLEGLTRRLDRVGCRTLGSSADAVALSGDKARLGRRLAEIGVPTPRTHLFEAGESPPEGWTYPAVVKPIDGAGSLETFRVERAADVARGEARLLQEFIPGRAMSATFLVAPGLGSRLVAIGEQRMDVQDGRIVYLGGIVPADCPGALEVAARAIDSVDGLAGYVGVDFIQEPGGRVVVLEINPRPTTSIVGLVQLLPPGLLADTWLAAFDDGERFGRAMARIEGLVADAAPVEFEASGSVRPASRREGSDEDG